MKKITFFLLFCISLNANASTSITTSSVSGHWNLAGSPYNIYNDITINLGDTLTIDPGVSIVFQGNYLMSVSGVIYSVGTLALPINYHINDTTGWAGITAGIGGWKGITFYPYSGSLPDNSTFGYCNIYDTKEYPSSLNRNLVMNNCNFFHNKSGAISVVTDSPFTTTIENCSFYNNLGQNVISFTASSTAAGSVHFHHNTVYQNQGKVAIINGSHVNLMVDSNKIYQNLQTDSTAGSVLQVLSSILVAKNNMIYENTTMMDGAVSTWGTVSDINGNYICNNRVVLSGTGGLMCGLEQGGGGIRIQDYEEPEPVPSSNIIRNNIIANNTTAYYGAAIYVLGANLSVYNNQIINNSAVQGGIYADCIPGYSLIIKNNIFYDNISYGYDIDFGYVFNDSMNLHMRDGSLDTLVYENNWTQRTYSRDVFLTGGTTFLIGDTLTNIIGNTPGLIAPTLTPSVTESALAADFGLLYTSNCINTGDSANADPFITDYAGSQRIVGSNIDIGAYEFNSFCPDTIIGVTSFCLGTSTTLSYPIPGGVWSSPQSSLIVNIDSVTGTVTGIAVGVATIYYRVGGCVASVNEIINTLPDSIVGQPQVCISASIILTSSPSGGIWNSSNATAIVSPGGMVTGISPGVDTIRYTVSNSCGTRAVTRILNILSTPSTITGADSVCLGSPETLTDATVGGTWASSDPAIAVISADTLTGISLGTPTITYTSSAGCYTTKTISVISCPTLLPLLNSNNSIKIYPNPACSSVFITTSEANGSVQLQDITGNIIVQKQVTGTLTSFDIHSIPRGIYFAVWNDGSGAKSVQKFVVE